LTIDAGGVDGGNNYYPLNPGVCIDYQFVGCAPLSISVVMGWHEVDIDSQVWEYGGCFDSTGVWYFDGNNWYQTYGGIPIYSDTYVFAGYTLEYG
jgi:hypothetical protein